MKYSPIFTGITSKADEMKIRKITKRIAKKRFRNCRDPYAASMMEEPRKGNCSYDGYTEYGLYELSEEQKSMTEQELEKLVYDEMAIPVWHSQYDCTGKPFTEFISVHRNPCGLISIIHHVGYDV